MKRLITLLFFTPLLVNSQSFVSTGNEVIHVQPGTSFSSVDGYKMAGAGTNILSKQQGSNFFNVDPASHRVLVTNPNARVEIRNLGNTQIANYYLDVDFAATRVIADLRIQNTNSAATYNVGLEQTSHTGFNDIPVEWSITRNGAAATDVHNLIFTWGNELETTQIPVKRLFRFDTSSNDWVQLPAANTSVDEFNKTLVYSGFEGGLTNTRYMIAQALSDVTLTSNFLPFDWCAGTTSDVQSFSVQGSNLMQALTVTSPANFEISLIPQGPFSTTITLNPISFNVQPTVIYIRVAQSASTAGVFDLIASSTVVFYNLISDTLQLTINADNTNPTIVAPAALTVSADANCEAVISALGSATTADNCTAASVTNNAPATFPLGATTVVWTVTDGAGNTATATQVVTVNDITAPVLTCNSDITVVNDSGTCGALVSFLDPIVSDNCSSTSNLEVITNGGFESGNTSWAFDNGTSANTGCDQPWIIGSNINPCSGLMSPVSSGTNAAITAFDGNGPTTYILSQSFDVPNGLVSANLSWIQSASIDIFGGLNRQFSVKVYDASNTTFIATLYTEAFVAGSFPFFGGTSSYDWTAMNVNALAALTPQQGNTLTLRFEAYVPEVYTGPGAFGIDDVSLILTGNTLPVIVQTAGLPSGSAFPVGTTTNTFTATDDAGNTSTCSFNITVTDNLAPVVTAPADVVVNANNSCAAFNVALGSPTASDNCTIAYVANNAPSIFVLGATTVTWTVTDNSGNTTSVTQLVTVNDNTNPTIVAPAAITVSANAACGAVISTLGNAVTADNCTVASVTNNAPVTFPIGATTVVWIVTDAAGNTATATQVVTVNDNITPTITAPANVAAAANASCVATGVVLGTAITADNCAVASVTNNAPATFPLGTTTVVWTVTDNAGNTATATQTVTVTDTQAPAVTAPANVVVTTNSSCAAFNVALGLPAATDNCTIASVTNNAPSIFALGVTTLTWTVTDNSGNTTTVTQLVTVNDNTNPTITAPEALTVSADANCAAVISTLGSATTADNCTVASVTNNAPATFPLGTTTVVWTVIDGAGNTATATQVVTVNDITAPVLTCNSDITVVNDSGTCGALVSFLDPIVSDNCSSTSNLEVITNGGFESGMTGWLVDAGTGSGFSCEQEWVANSNICPCNCLMGPITSGSNAAITAFDGNGPTTYIFSQSFDVPNGLVSANLSWIQSASIDVFGALNRQFSVKVYDASNTTFIATLYTEAFVAGSFTTYDWTAMSVNALAALTPQQGNTLTLRFEAYVPEVYTGPGAFGIDDVSLILTGNTLPEIVQTAGLPSGSTFPVGTTTNTFTATDDAGNTSTCSFDVTVTDTQAPAVTAPANVVVTANSSCAAFNVALGLPAATDNCTIASITNNAPSVFALGATTVTWTVTDNSGNTTSVTQLVTVNDNTNPTIVAPAAITVSADANCEAVISTLGNATTADNCTVASVTNNAPATFPLGTTTVVWTVTDGAGNTATATQVVTVNDITGPVLICNPDIFVNVDANDCSALVDFVVTATDNCGQGEPVSYDFESGLQGWTIGTIDGVNTWGLYTSSGTATAFGSNGTMVGTFNNGDLGYENSFIQSPVFNATGGGTVSFDFLVNNEEYSFDQEIFEVSYDNGTTWTMLLGNQLPNDGTAVFPGSFDIPINDGTSTTILRVRFDSGDGCCGPQDGFFVDNILFTPLSSIVISSNFDSGDSFPLGTTTVVTTATDESGNTSTCSFNITVTDNQVPAVTAPADVVVSANNSCAAFNVALGSPTASDNCTIAYVANNAPSVFVLGATTVTWTVTDNSGNTTSVTQLVTVNDNTNPTIVAPAALTVSANAACGAVISTLGNTVTADNCTVASVTNNAPATFPLGTTTVIWTVTDAAGNTATATQVVTVIDNTNPTITAPANIAASANASCAATTVVLGTPITADNCGVASVTNNAPTTFPLGTTTVVWTVTDNAGNTATATQTVTVTDTQAPAVTAPANVVVNANSSCAAFNVALGLPVATDNCAVTSITNNAPSIFVLGVTTVTWTIKDASGNTTTVTQLVTVNDNTNPTIVAPAALTVSANAACGAVISTLGNTVTADNCTVASLTNNAPATFPLGTTTVVWTVTDGAGNTATATQVVTVIDNTNPSITAPANIAASANASCVATGVVLGTPITADNCGVASVTNNAPATFPLGTTTVTWTVTDNAGNTTTATQTVTVTDTQAPVVTAPADVVMATNFGCEAIGVPLGIVSASDNCVVDYIENDAPMIYPLGVTTVTWTVKDASGNTTIVTQLVTVIDNVLPLITAPISLEVISNAGCDATGVNLGNPITSDNCGIASVTNDAPTTFLLGTTTVTWTVTDNAGNVTSATQTIVVVDLVAPTAVLNDITITLPLGGINAVIDASIIDAGSFDNCGEVTFQLSQTSFSCEHIGQNTISVIVSDDLGNTTTETVVVTVLSSGIDSDLDGIDDSCDDEIIDDIAVPTGFTPDGDGINDQFVIVGLEENNAVSLKVFNRYGNSVYVNDNYQNDWNGTSSLTNLDLPDGTYFYVLAIDNVDVKSGYVYMNRVY